MSPVFRHGGLRLYLLKLLAEEPRHGYDVIRLLQDRFLGVYSPSPGTIYPRLARLEEEGLVTHEVIDGKKVYRITEAGQAELNRRTEDLASLEEELSASVRDIARELSRDVRETVRSLRDELTWAVREAGRAGQSREAGRAGQSGTSRRAASQSPPRPGAPGQESGQDGPDGHVPAAEDSDLRDPDAAGIDGNVTGGRGENEDPADAWRQATGDASPRSAATGGTAGGEAGREDRENCGGRRGRAAWADRQDWRNWAERAERQDWRRFAHWARQDWRNWAEQAERDWSLWAEEAEHEWRDQAERESWPEGDRVSWRDWAGKRDWPWWAERPGPPAASGQAGVRQGGGRGEHPAETAGAGHEGSGGQAHESSPASGAAAGKGQADDDAPNVDHDGDFHGATDLAGELGRLAAGFVREVHRATWHHAGSVGEESIGRLGGILADALDRIRREVFTPPGPGTRDGGGSSR